MYTAALPALRPATDMPGAIVSGRHMVISNRNSPLTGDISSDRPTIMLAMRPRIVHKGLILLFVPLAFEALVAASLIYLQHYYGESVKAETLRKQIVFHINEFWYHNINMTTTNLAQIFFPKYRANWTTAEKAANEYALLKPLLAGDQEQLAQLEEIMKAHALCRSLCEELAPSPGGAGGFGQILAMRRNLNTFKRLLAANIETGDLIRRFRKYELLQSVTAADQVKQVASLMQLLLAGAILGSTVIAYFLFHYFMRGIHRGVQALVQNIERFKAGEQLLPAIEGTDEIALLDARFHEMAEQVAAAQRMKQAFVTTMSRQFRVPISATKEFLGELSQGTDETLSERARTRAEKNEQSLERLIGLINELLALKTPGVSRIQIEPRPCSLFYVIQSSIDSVSALADKNGIRLESGDTQAEAYADPDRIVQVLVNLLSNAIKFSPSHSSVVVSTATIGDQVEIRIRDAGRGVPAHLRHSIFERFQQVASTDATEKGGTGLGLPICREIVELHGGSIGVESEEGKGSTFWFRLPAHAKGRE